MRRRSRFRRLVLGVVIAAPVLSACGDGRGAQGPDSQAPGDSGPLSGSLTVLAAASLTDPFNDIAAAFEAAHPGVDVRLSFDGSSKLATQILEGVPGDVFAAADEASLSRVSRAGRALGDAVVFAINELRIVVPAGNPLGINGPEDLTDGVLVALCRLEVPCGTYAAQAFERAGLTVPAAVEEDNVKGVVTKVQLGEVDAGVVYKTDVLAAEGVEGVDLPAVSQVQATYPASMLADTANPRAAAAFVKFLVSDDAQVALAQAGFTRP